MSDVAMFTLFRPSHTQGSRDNDDDGLDPKLLSSVMCGCHMVVKDKVSHTANMKLVIASFIALFFMIAEVLGLFIMLSLFRFLVSI